jgi:HSP20 family protein
MIGLDDFLVKVEVEEDSLMTYSGVSMPVVSKDRIKIYAYDNTVEVKSIDPRKRYHHTFEIPPETDIETVKSTYNNGILEITFNKRGQTKRKGKIIRVE